jgi:site-specific DNA-cytosine methylase
MRVVDYFAGAGGFTEASRSAGATVVCAINHWPRAVETHRANHPEVDARAALDAGLRVGGAWARGAEAMR